MLVRDLLGDYTTAVKLRSDWVRGAILGSNEEVVMRKIDRQQ